MGQADEGTAKMKEGLMDIRPALIADRQAAILAQPGQRTLHDPALAPQAGAALHALARATHLDPPLAQGEPPAGDVVRLVRVHLVRALAWSPPWPLDGPDAVDQRLEDVAIGAVGRGEEDGEREALPVDHNVALAARFAAIRRIWPGFRAPLLAGAKALSALARLQSILSASPKRSNSAWCRRAHTPACCQSRRRRQQVTPLPQPNSCGSISQGMPLLSTKMMPLKAAWSGTRGRPPFGLGGSGGNSGAMISHNVSLTNGLLISRAQAARPVPRF
jgi:hypothetical protein